MKFLIFLIGVSLLFILLAYSNRVEKRKLFARFSDRSSMSNQKFYEEYYRAVGLPREVVEELRIHVAVTLSLPLEKIIPSDRFDIELAPSSNEEFDSGAAILSYEAGKLAHDNGVVLEPGQIKTLDDYIRLVAPIWKG